MLRGRVESYVGGCVEWVCLRNVPKIDAHRVHNRWLRGCVDWVCGKVWVC